MHTWLLQLESAQTTLIEEEHRALVMNINELKGTLAFENVRPGVVYFGGDLPVRSGQWGHNERS